MLETHLELLGAWSFDWRRPFLRGNMCQRLSGVKRRRTQGSETSLCCTEMQVTPFVAWLGRVKLDLIRKKNLQTLGSKSQSFHLLRRRMASLVVPLATSRVDRLSAQSRLSRQDPSI